MVKYFVANSLDGFIAREDGSADWLFMDQDYGMTEFFGTVDVAVMGRKTYDKALELSPGQVLFPNMESHVFSRTKLKSESGTLRFVSEDVETWTNSVREKPGKDIWLVGGGDLVRQFLQKHLVDEIVLTIHPRLLGSGISLFPQPYPETELELVGCRQYSTGLVQVFYRVK
jgi:dihydrofolate reductase